MSIDIRVEAVIPLREAAKILPARRAGRPTNISTLFRWSTPPGLEGITLETLQIGGCRCTSKEALQRYFDALTARRKGRIPAPPPEAKHRRQAIDAAKRRVVRKRQLARNRA